MKMSIDLRVHADGLDEVREKLREVDELIFELQGMQINIQIEKAEKEQEDE